MCPGDVQTRHLIVITGLWQSFWDQPISQVRGIEAEAQRGQAVCLCHTWRISSGMGCRLTSGPMFLTTMVHVNPPPPPPLALTHPCPRWPRVTLVMTGEHEPSTQVRVDLQSRVPSPGSFPGAPWGGHQGCAGGCSSLQVPGPLLVLFVLATHGMGMWALLKAQSYSNDLRPQLAHGPRPYREPEEQAWGCWYFSDKRQPQQGHLNFAENTCYLIF